MSNTVKIELSIPELVKLTELAEQLLAKFGTPEGAQQAVADVVQCAANPTPVGTPSVNSPLAASAPATGAAATPAGTFPASANPAPTVPFTAPAPVTSAPLPPAAAPNAYTSTPSQAYPFNPPAASQQQPTYPPQIQQPAPTPQQPPVTTGVTYTMEQLAAAGGPIMNRGDGPKLVAALAKYGVQALTMLKPEQYASFAADLRALGAQI